MWVASSVTEYLNIRLIDQDLKNVLHGLIPKHSLVRERIFQLDRYRLFSIRNTISNRNTMKIWQ